MVALQLNALQRHHRAHLVQAARGLKVLTDDQRASLSIGGRDPAEADPRVERFYLRLCALLESEDAGVDPAWFADQPARAAIPPDVLTSTSVAADGTDVETWGAPGARRSPSSSTGRRLRPSSSTGSRLPPRRRPR